MSNLYTKIYCFQDLTGIEDTNVCRALLESQDWDLESTAREHLGIQSEPNNENDPPARQEVGCRKLYFYKIMNKPELCIDILIVGNFVE